MTFPINTIVLVITATATALIAGLFYSWSCSVTPGLSRLPDTEFIRAMQSLNRAILNPVFFLSFFGTLVLLPVSTFLYGREALSLRFWLLLAAALVYLTGVFGVTFFGNVPLNEELDAFNLDGASLADIAHQRTRFEQSWNSLNNIRTVASTLAIILVVIACLSSHRTPATR